MKLSIRMWAEVVLLSRPFTKEEGSGEVPIVYWFYCHRKLKGKEVSKGVLRNPMHHVHRSMLGDYITLTLSYHFAPL